MCYDRKKKKSPYKGEKNITRKKKSRFFLFAEPTLSQEIVLSSFILLFHSSTLALWPPSLRAPRRARCLVPLSIARRRPVTLSELWRRVLPLAISICCASRQLPVDLHLAEVCKCAVVWSVCYYYCLVLCSILFATAIFFTIIYSYFSFFCFFLAFVQEY